MKQKPPIEEVKIRAVRSRGPGGQNVNKVSTAAQLKWDFMSSQSLSENEKLRLAGKLANQINNDGEVYLRSDRFRSLPRNKQDTYEKLLAMVQNALKVRKKRKKTKPSRAQKEKRLTDKSHKSSKKGNRKAVKWP